MKWPFSLKLAAAAAAMILSIPESAQAQFTYFTGGFSGRFTPIQWELAADNNTTMGTVSFNLGAIHRPVRAFAAGLEFEIPLTQSNSFSYRDAPVSGGGSFSDFEFTSASNRYLPQEYDYTLRNNVHTRLLLRFYTGGAGEDGMFIEGRAAVGSLSEEFTFVRREIPADISSGTSRVPGRNIRHSNNRTASSLGLAYGSMRSFESGFYYEYRIGWDRYFFDIEGDNFRYNAEVDGNNNDHAIATFESRILENSGSWFLNFSMGYFF